MMSARAIVVALSVALLSGGLFYYSIDFNHTWPLLWLAPIPVLVYSYHHRMLISGAVAFLALSIGKLTVLTCLGTGVSITFILANIIIDPMVFSLIVMLNKWVIMRYCLFLACLVFPSLWTSYEFGLSFISPHGAITSFAYDQLHFLPFIQLVSVTGIWGATFVLLTFASGISYATYTDSFSDKWISITLAVMLPLLCVLYGQHRLQHYQDSAHDISVGLVCVNVPPFVFDDKAVSLSQRYPPLIQQAAKAGARLMVLPERIVSVTHQTYDTIMHLFQQAAKQHQMTLVVGIARLGEIDVNAAVIINDKGKLIGTYDKQHLLPGLEARFTPGDTLFYSQNPVTWGVAICKDMDFAIPSEQYAHLRTQLLLVPALDFNRDAWYHGRLAIMRGIEYGFAVARASAHGYVSLSDALGRIIDMKPSFTQPSTVLVNSIPLYSLHTLYARWGNWFAWMILSYLGLTLLCILFRR